MQIEEDNESINCEANVESSNELDKTVNNQAPSNGRKKKTPMFK
jgi:hypothetical protein